MAHMLGSVLLESGSGEAVGAPHNSNSLNWLIVGIVVLMVVRMGLRNVLKVCFKKCGCGKDGGGDGEGNGDVHVEVFLNKPDPAFLLGFVKIKQNDLVDDVVVRVAASLLPHLEAPPELEVFACRWPPTPPLLVPLAPTLEIPLYQRGRCVRLCALLAETLRLYPCLRLLEQCTAVPATKAVEIFTSDRVLVVRVHGAGSVELVLPPPIAATPFHTAGGGRGKGKCRGRGGGWDHGGGRAVRRDDGGSLGGAQGKCRGHGAAEVHEALLPSAESLAMELQPPTSVQGEAIGGAATGALRSTEGRSGGLGTEPHEGVRRGATKNTTSTMDVASAV